MSEHTEPNNKPKPTVSSVFNDFLGYTTAHGFGRYEAAHGFGKFIWIVFLLGTYAGFSFHLSTLVTRFLAKPLLTVYDPKFEYQFPDIYVCPRNPISMSRLVSKLTEEQSNFLRMNVELTRERFINLLNNSRNSLTDKQIIKLLDFDIWAGNVTFSPEYVQIADVLQNVEQQIMAILMAEDEAAKPQHEACYSLVDKGKNSYKGTKSVTAIGHLCDKWPASYPTEHAEGHNYCRNPDNKRAPCFTANPSVNWEYCAVPVCKSSISNSTCYDRQDLGKNSYRGKKATTKSGLTCQMWNTTTPHNHTEVVLNSENYCRNPDDTSTGPWCFTTNSTVRRETCAIHECPHPDVEWEPCAVPRCTDENIKVITSIIHNRIGDMLLHMFGNDLYFNLIKCTIGEEHCTSNDFTTFAHPAFGICHKLDPTRFIANKNVKQIILMPIKMELFADSTDIKGQEYEVPKVKSLGLSMYPIGSSSSSKGYDIYVMPQKEYLHNIPPLFRANRIKVQSATHTYVHLGFNKKETFPDGTCIESQDASKISYEMHTWKSYLFDRPNVTSASKNISTNVINQTENWKDQLNKLERMYASTVDSKIDLVEFTSTQYDCMNTELIKTFLTNCNCIPAILPIPAKYSDKTKYPHCLDGPINVVKRAKCYQQQLDKMSTEIEDVRARCPPRCGIAKYDISFYSVPWPFNNLQDIRSALKPIAKTFGYPYHFNKWRGISGLFYAYFMTEHLLNLKEDGQIEDNSATEYLVHNKLFQGISSNLAKVTIEATGAHGELVYSEEAYPVKNLFADLGGLLGLWSGISVLTICEILELFIYFIIIIHKRRRSSTSGSINLKTYDNNGYTVNNKA